MAAQRVVVRYQDGTKAEFNPNRPRLLLEMEKRWGVQVPEKHQHVFWLAHYAVGGDEPFEEWVDRVEEVDTVDLEPEGDDGEGKGDRS